MDIYWIGVIILTLIYYTVIFPMIPKLIKRALKQGDGTWSYYEGEALLLVLVGVFVSSVVLISYWIIPLAIVYVITIPVRKWLKKRL